MTLGQNLLVGTALNYLRIRISTPQKLAEYSLGLKVDQLPEGKLCLDQWQENQVSRGRTDQSKGPPSAF